jgi:8-oxo-dGTP diphosphatase
VNLSKIRVAPSDEFLHVQHMATPLFQVIVCAAIRDTNGRILLTRRAPGKKLAGFWEFPGGKLEHGEECEAALRRELHEELGITVTVTKLLQIKSHVYEHGAVLILFYLCENPQGQIKLIDHDKMAWLTPQELSEHEGLLPANREVLKILSEV